MHYNVYVYKLEHILLPVLYITGVKPRTVYLTTTVHRYVVAQYLVRNTLNIYPNSPTFLGITLVTSGCFNTVPPGCMTLGSPGDPSTPATNQIPHK